MNLELSMIFVCLGLGLLAPRLGPRQQAALVVLASCVTALYFVLPNRFM